MYSMKSFIIFLTLHFACFVTHAQQQNSHTASFKPELVIPLGHSSSVSFATFSPDGSLVATCGNGPYGTDIIKLWDVRTGCELRSFSTGASGVVFSPNSMQILSYGFKDEMELWDVMTREKVRSFKGTYLVIRAASFSSDGKLIVSCSLNSKVRLWDVETGKGIKTLANHFHETLDVKFTNDDKSVAIVTRSNPKGKVLNVAWWNINMDSVERSVPTDTNNTSLITYLSHDAKYLVTTQWIKKGLSIESEVISEFSDTTNRFGLIKIYDTTTGGLLHLIGSSNIPHDIFNVAFALDSKSLLVNRSLGSISIVNIETGKETLVVEGIHTISQGSSLAYNRDGKTMLVAGLWHSRSVIKLFDLTTGRETHTLAGYSQGIQTLALSPDGYKILASNHVKDIACLYLKGGFYVSSFVKDTSYTNYITISENGTLAVTVSGDKKIKLWDTDKRQLLRTFENDIFLPTTCITFGKNVKYLYSGNRQYLMAWDVSSGKKINQFLIKDLFLETIALSPDGQTLLLGGVSRSAPLRLWNVKKGVEVKKFSDNLNQVCTVAYSPSGKIIVSGGTDGLVRLRHLDNPELVEILGKHEREVNALAFSIDGNFVLSGSWDRTVKVWEVKSGKLMNTFRGHQASVSALVSLPDNKHFISGSLDGTLRIWNKNADKEILMLISFTDGQNWVAIAPDGRFDGTKDGIEKLYFVQGLTKMPISLFFEKRYTPNLISKTLNGE